MRNFLYVAFSLVLAANAVAETPAADPEGIEFFEKKIRPVLVERCYSCHSSSAKKLEASLLLDSREGMHKGGDLGPAVVPGKPDESLLVQAIRYSDENLQMPPEGRLPDEVVADFETWIKRGAPDPRNGSPAAAAKKIDIAAARQRWPYAPLVEPAIPPVRNAAWPRNAIDRFILARLEAQGLAPATDAEPRILLRRATYDLVGLPPTPDELAAFTAEAAVDMNRGQSQQAWEAAVERLLASPQYGERWGRHWLDVVRYADTAGDNSDYPIPQMVKYRNWVIDALNADMPYDQFIREQIAGDLLPAETDAQHRAQIIATGYLANARRFGSRVSDYPQHLTIEDTIDNLGRAFLGHTLNCARCHDHKFDPFTTEDYYAVYGIFHSTRYPWPGIELEKRQRDLVPLVPPNEVAAALAERKKQLEQLAAAQKQAEQNKKEAEKEAQAAQSKVDDPKRGEPSADDRAAAEKELAAAKTKAKQRDEEFKAAKKAKENLENSPLPFEQAYAVAEAKKIENCQVQLKGDPTRLGAEVPRRFPEVFGGQLVPEDESGSGRRQLADWIASADNPLTARVMVNRIWHYHFGRGLVATPNDFGKQGQPPSHPELLDYLALRFVESGWSVKAMHRLILASRTYQQAGSGKHGTQSSVDPSNVLLSHFPRRRLDAEALRDTLLVLGGNLDRSRGGEHPFPPQQEWDFTQHKPFKAVYETNRRSVYLMTQRIQRHPYLAIFDGADTGASTARRTTSTTTLQALYLLNDPFFHEQSSRLAARLIQSHESDAERIGLAYRLAFSREPTEAERSLGEAHLAKVCGASSASEGETEQQRRAAWESYVRVLLRTNEFVYLN